MADVATNIRGTTDAHERNNSVVVGAPKAAGTDALGNNYTIRAGGNRATATITFTGAATADETIVIIDAEGTSTEHNPAAAHMQDESTNDEISGASDYGTLA